MRQSSTLFQHLPEMFGSFWESGFSMLRNVASQVVPMLYQPFYAALVPQGRAQSYYLSLMKAKEITMAVPSCIPTVPANPSRVNEVARTEMVVGTKRLPDYLLRDPNNGCPMVLKPKIGLVAYVCTVPSQVFLEV